MTYGNIDIRRTLVVGAGQHRDNVDNDSLDSVDWQPSLTGLLVPIDVIAGWVLIPDIQVNA